MTRLTVSAKYSAVLSAASGPVQICDESGRILGMFEPVERKGYRESDAAESPYTLEEVQEFAKEPGGRPPKDILADLQGNS